MVLQLRADTQSSEHSLTQLRQATTNLPCQNDLRVARGVMWERSG